jgi:alpha-D-glucose phosphate-specific phosphoglucomutase
LCTQAIANYLKSSGLARSLVIGCDTRFASADFARACAEVLAANDIKVYLCEKPTPTPVVSWGIVVHQAGGGIVITASHNPAIWNGLKYKSQDGASAPVEVVDQIEQHLRRLQPADVKRLGVFEAFDRQLIEYTDIRPAYLAQVRRLIDLDELKKARFKIAVDSMHGAGAGYFRWLLDGGQSEIIEINAEPNPNFPGMKQPEPIGLNLNKLAFTVKETGASVGLATDGDADRLGIMDEHGNYINQLQVYALLALYLLEVRQLRGPIVKTITTSNMLNKLGAIYGVPVFEVAVGFKYVAPVMQQQDALIGGEESGGYGFRGHVPERDGLVAGLFFLDFMARTDKTPSQLLDYLYSKVGPHYYNRYDAVFDESERSHIVQRLTAAMPEIIDGARVVFKDTQDGFRFVLEKDSWLLIRFSGTEPLLRIYAESDSPAAVEQLLVTGRNLAGVS